MRNKRIGFFDSGVGGLTIVEAVHALLPSYATVYLGDTGRAPYGDRSHRELVEYTWQGCRWLFEQDCDLVIVACNSASAGALREIQQQRLPAYPGKRVLGVIRPTVEVLANRGYKSILVLSTNATQKSQAYVHEFAKLDPSISVTSHSCPRWASMVEGGLAGTVKMRHEVERELATRPRQAQSVEAVLLACTHYPYVKADVERAVGPSVPVFDQGTLVAKSLSAYLQRHPEIESLLNANSDRDYYVTADPSQAQKIASDFFGFKVNCKRVRLG